MSTPATQKKHHKFKMPHMLFLVLILLFVLSALTYIIPAGQFAKNENGDHAVFRHWCPHGHVAHVLHRCNVIRFSVCKPHLQGSQQISHGSCRVV